MHRPVAVMKFSLPKKWEPQRKDFSDRCGFPAFIGFLYLPLAWKVLT